MGHILGEHIKNVWIASKKAQQSEADILGKTLLSVARHCFESKFECHEESDAAMSQATLNSIQRYIQTNLASSELSPESICQAFNFSRSYLYRLFEPLGGVACQIQQQRLEKCYQTLIDLKSKYFRISEVAFYWGFNNQSHFSRLFRKTHGITPKQARELRKDLTKQEMMKVTKIIDDQNTPDYQKWLLGL